MGFAEAMHDSGVVMTSSRGPDTEAEERHVQRRGPGIGRDGVRRPAEPGERGLELAHHGALGDPAALHDLVHGPDLVRADVRPRHRNAPGHARVSSASASARATRSTWSRVRPVPDGRLRPRARQVLGHGQALARRVRAAGVCRGERTGVCPRHGRSSGRAPARPTPACRPGSTEFIQNTLRAHGASGWRRDAARGRQRRQALGVPRGHLALLVDEARRSSSPGPRPPRPADWSSGS